MQQQGPKIQPTILLVEDDEDTRRVYSLMLCHAGFRVVEAATGPDAVQQAIDEHPDLILMDMNLPTIDGWEAARRIRADSRVGAAPMIAFSALIDCTADLRRESSQFDGFIAKPVTPSELVRRVAAYVSLLGRVTKPVATSQARRAPRAPAVREALGGTALQ